MTEDLHGQSETKNNALACKEFKMNAKKQIVEGVQGENIYT